MHFILFSVRLGTRKYRFRYIIIIIIITIIIFIIIIKYNRDVTDATTNGLKLFPTNTKLLSILSSISSLSSSLMTLTSMKTATTGMDLEIGYYHIMIYYIINLLNIIIMTKGTKLLPLLIHIQHANLKTNTNANTPNNDNDSTKSMKEWDADSVSTIRVYIENLLDDPSFSSLPHLWFIIIIIIIIIINLNYYYC